MRPRIGITIDASDNPSNYESPRAYAASVDKGGGLPLLIPFDVGLSLVTHYVNLLDGFLFSGGDDLDPAAYGEQRHPKAIPVDPRREAFERALLAEVERRRMPALGICMGSQLMNVHRGGSLIQFLPDSGTKDLLEHRKNGEDSRRHPIRLEPDSKIGRAVSKVDLSVNTNHKQAVARLGKGLKIIATAPDGIIEGFEDPTLPFFMAVQWHPERLSDEPEHLAPFKLLVDAAARAKK